MPAGADPSSGKLHRAWEPRIWRAAVSYARAASSAESNVPSHRRWPTVGSRISAAHLPQGRCRTPRYAFSAPAGLPAALALPADAEAGPLPATAAVRPPTGAVGPPSVVACSPALSAEAPPAGLFAPLGNPFAAGAPCTPRPASVPGRSPVFPGGWRRRPFGVAPRLPQRRAGGKCLT